MDDKDIRNDQCVKDFLRMRSLREVTKEAYISRIKYFSIFIDKTPTKLIEEAEEEEEKGIRPRKRKLNNYFLDFIEWMEKNNKSRYTIKSYIETIKAFYHYFDIITPKIKLNNNNENKVFETIPEVKHVKAVLKVSGIRDKAIILLMFSSGMGLSEVKELNFGDFLDAMSEYLDLDNEDIFKTEKIFKLLKKEDNCIGTWKTTRFKTGMPYITFNSPESTHAIVDYLIYRKNHNKLIKSLDDPIFVNNRNERLTKSTFSQSFQRLNSRAGFGTSKNKKRRFFTSHMLRKLFTTTLYNHGLDQMTVDWFLGHRINPTTEAYFKSNPEDLKKRYTKVVEHLVVGKINVKQVTTKEYDEILRDSRKKDDKIEAMEKKMELMDKILKNMMKNQLENVKND